MPSDEKIVRVRTLDEFDRELARDGGEALEVPASLRSYATSASSPSRSS